MHMCSGATFSIIDIRAGTAGASTLDAYPLIMIKAPETYTFSTKTASVHFSDHAAYIADTRDLHKLPQNFLHRNL